MSDLSRERIEEALAAADFWLRTLEPCDCPEEVYPTGDRRTMHDPFCSTVMFGVAAALRGAQDENERLREALEDVREWLRTDEGGGPFPVTALGRVERALAVSPPADEAKP